MFFLSNDVDVVVIVKTNKQQEQEGKSKKENGTQKKVAKKYFLWMERMQIIYGYWIDSSLHNIIKRGNERKVEEMKRNEKYFTGENKGISSNNEGKSCDVDDMNAFIRNFQH